MATLFVKIFPRNLQHIEISAIAKRKPSAEKVGQPARAKPPQSAFLPANKKARTGIRAEFRKPRTRVGRQCVNFVISTSRTWTQQEPECRAKAPPL